MGILQLLLRKFSFLVGQSRPARLGQKGRKIHIKSGHWGPKELFGPYQAKYRFCPLPATPLISK